jgi:para-aminobenzoate synthetase component I
LEKIQYKWHSPIDYARALNNQKEDFVFLYSSLNLDFSGRYSFLAFKPKEYIVADDWTKLEEALSSDESCYENSWFGYLGYGLKNSLEKLPEDSEPFIKTPRLLMACFNLLLVFDHLEETCFVWSGSSENLKNIPMPVAEPKEQCVEVETISSNMNRLQYFENVEKVLEAIKRGDLSQANLTRKFFGAFKSKINAFEIFAKICKVSPAPYSSFLRLKGYEIVSSSPERFLTLDNNSKAESRPIKGSAPRFSDIKKDEESLRQLANSSKDKAENLMIVDLMRNDFAKGSETGSVQVSDLFEITSYATVHHMSSTVTAEKKAAVSSLEFVKNSFPPGSMTGTPKIKAMEICSQLERQERGVYSGAIGWFGGDGSVDLSVVIRTLIIQGNKFEFQVGGAIIADSTPENEWQETLVKAKGICLALGLHPEEFF